MDVQRALVAKSIAESKIHLLISRGVIPELFTQDESGLEVSAVFRWVTEHSRRYGTCPSQAFLQHNFPSWRGEYSTEPVEALLDEFLAEVRRRYFESKIIELSQLPKTDPGYWDRRDSLHEVLLEAARDVAAVIPSGRVARFSDDFEFRIEAYEQEHGKHRTGTPLGIPVVDQTTDGIKPGWVITNAGFSGLGKSFLTGLNMLSAFEDDKVALLLSAEMSAREVEDRLHTMVMHWQHNDFMRHALSDIQIKHWKDVARIYSKARGEILILDRFGGGTIDRVHAEIERYKPDVCAIDYVQRMKLGYGKRLPKWEQLEEITNDLKTIAMDTDTAIIMVSQDGRDAAEVGSTRSNMGGSISVYQAADVYLGMMADDSMRAQGKMRIKMLKFRHGPCAEVDVVWDPSTGTFGKMWTDVNQFQRAPVA